MPEKKKKPVGDPRLKSWAALNAVITGMGEKACISLLEKEKRGRKRAQFLKRIYSRLNKVRADRERAALLEK